MARSLSGAGDEKHSSEQPEHRGTVTEHRAQRFLEHKGQLVSGMVYPGAHTTSPSRFPPARFFHSDEHAPRGRKSTPQQLQRNACYIPSAALMERQRSARWFQRSPRIALYFPALSTWPSLNQWLRLGMDVAPITDVDENSAVWASHSCGTTRPHT